MMFQRNLLPNSYLLGLLFGSEDGGSTFLQNTGEFLLDYMCYIPENGIYYKYKFAGHPLKKGM
jgi:hypothetical protein